MKKRYEFEIWAPDGVVACLEGIAEFVTAHKLLFLWFLGVGVVAFSAPDNEAGTAWAIWVGLASAFLAIVMEIFRDRKELDIPARWKVNRSSFILWYGGLVLLVYGIHSLSYLPILGVGILLHAVLAGGYHMACKDELEKERKRR